MIVAHIDKPFVHQGLLGWRFLPPEFGTCKTCVFHDFSAQIDSHLGVGLPVTDCMLEVLNSVRLPCAQMDFFAVMLQAVADRLVSTGSNQQDLDTFDKLVKISKAIRGCGYMNPAFQNAESMSCYRSPHWYS